MKKEFDMEEYSRNPEKWDLTDDLDRRVEIKEKQDGIYGHVIGYVKEKDSDEWVKTGLNPRYLFMEEKKGKFVIGCRQVTEGKNKKGEPTKTEKFRTEGIGEYQERDELKNRLWKTIMNAVSDRMDDDDMKLVVADKEKGFVNFVWNDREEHWDIFEREIDL